jgi:hypothetical protein
MLPAPRQVVVAGADLGYTVNSRGDDFGSFDEFVCILLVSPHHGNATTVKLRDNKDRYCAVSRLNPWLGAVAILVLLGIWLYFHEMSSGEVGFYWLRLYVALVFAPLTFRFSWRFVSHAPAPLQQAP